MRDFIKLEYQKTAELFNLLINDKELHNNIRLTAEECINSLRNNGKIILCGNGGSAADSQHIAAELVGRLTYDRPGIAAIALTTDSSALTAIGNDYGFEHIFSRQIEAIGNKGDILIGISTSGKSKNILKAIEIANNKNIKTIGLLGKEGRDIGEKTSISININSEVTAKIQEAHIATGHILCGLIQDELFGKSNDNKN